MSTKTIRPRKTLPKNDKLTDQEQVFVRELMVDGSYNATEAARRSGAKNPGVQAARWLKTPRVQRALGHLQHTRNTKLELTAESLMRELAYAAMRDPLDLCDFEGNIMVDDMRRVPKRMRACIDGIEQDTMLNPVTGVVTKKIKLKLTPKLAALELAMKHFGMLAPQEHNVKVSVDWDKLYDDGSQRMPDPNSDAIEGRIREVKALVSKPSEPNIIDAQFSQIKEPQKV